VNRRVSFREILLVVGCVIAGQGPSILAAEGSARHSHAANAERLSTSFSPETRRLEFEATGTTGIVYELRIVTDGLSKPELGGDVNEPGIIYLPPPTTGANAEESSETVENLFFFNELRNAAGWELVIRCDPGQQGSWKLNGRFSPLGGELRAELVIPVDALEHGENLLHLRTARPVVPKMFFRRRFRSGEKIAGSVTVIPHDWSATVSLWRPTDGDAQRVLAENTISSVAARVQQVTVSDHWWDDRTELSDRALAVGKNLLSAQVTRPGSLFEGGFNLVYDPSRRAHRMSHWIWAWGPSIDLLLRLSKTAAAHSAHLALPFRAAALSAAKRSLEFEVTAQGHAALGVSTVRWEPSRATPQGWAEYISTADSLFMGGWGWMSAYAETQEPVYLRRMTSLVGAAERLMTQYPVVPQDWIVERGRWTPHTLDESVFGTIGFRRLYESTGSNQVAIAGRRFLDSHLQHMGREGGLLARAWMREENKEIWDPDIKGHAWVIEGYLDAYRLSKDTKYLELAQSLAQRVIDCQSADGSWTYLFKRATAADHVDDKGTAIWAYLFYDLYKITKDVKHLEAGRRALGWCLRHQYRGADSNLDGAIFHENGMAYVRRRPMTILYTTTFFGLALLEELALAPAH
jgi:hypothetical protein